MHIFFFNPINMSNANFSSVENTVYSASNLQPAINQITASNAVLVLSTVAAPVNLFSNTEYVAAALGSGLVVSNNATNAVTVGADTAANALAIQNALGLTVAGQSVILRFVFLTA